MRNKHQDYLCIAKYRDRNFGVEIHVGDTVSLLQVERWDEFCYALVDGKGLKNLYIPLEAFIFCFKQE